MPSANIIELIRQLKLVTEPHCRVAKLAIEMLTEQDVTITNLRAELHALCKDRSDA